MLPYIDGGTTYTDFEPLYRNKKQDREGRHGFQCRFVEENYKPIRYEFEKLHDMSENARYMNYKFLREDADNAKKYLLEIKEFVLKQEKATR